MMSAVQVVKASVVKVAAITSVVAVGPQMAQAKTAFSQTDLAAVGLETADVPPSMQAASFTIAVVLPWLEHVRSEAAKALSEM
ncbi:hypothetical protein PWP93_36525 [Paraburkholderia sp. A1RI-2L]|uniref:hypothetical protein n=1 Tax=Paraburkholderia sp. A1RI-2L TaxID=3028367 RepID=UPI003B7C2476